MTRYPTGLKTGIFTETGLNDFIREKTTTKFEKRHIDINNVPVNIPFKIIHNYYSNTLIIYCISEKDGVEYGHMFNGEPVIKVKITAHEHILEQTKDSESLFYDDGNIIIVYSDGFGITVFDLENIEKINYIEEQKY